jgi:hypothetical protein
MATCLLQVEESRPYFAEIPYYLWGQVNYDSEGDCKKPTDREWTWIYLQNRDTREVVAIQRKVGDSFQLEGDDATLARLSQFFVERSRARPLSALAAVDASRHAEASQRATRVAREFEQPALTPFDNHFFWGSWKWIGWFATELTWVGRWIMHSVAHNDARAISLCVDWLKAPPRFPEQESALCYAVQRLSGEPARVRTEWVRWYEGGWWFTKGAKSRYPEPNMEAWLAELKAEFGG